MTERDRQLKRYEEVGRILEALYDSRLTVASAQKIYELEEEAEELESMIWGTEKGEKP